jgi:hypothetical protein
VPNMTVHARRFLAEHRVDAVVLDQRLTGPWPGIMAALGVRPQLVGGVLLYRVTPRRRSRTSRTRPAQAIPTSTPRATIASGEPRSSRLPPSAL